MNIAVNVPNYPVGDSVFMVVRENTKETSSSPTLPAFATQLE
jgi:hypothetical protein